ncbi:MAG: hypothetical protein V2A79_08060 [Planctomycetota bacterium]
MKVSFTANGTTTSAELADDEEGARVRWGSPPDVQAMVDTLTYPEAATADNEPRGNLQAAFSLAVGRQHASLGAAMLYCVQECFARAGRKGTLTWTETGATLNLLNTTLARAHVVMQIGVYVVIEYQFIGGNL